MHFAIRKRLLLPAIAAAILAPLTLAASAGAVQNSFTRTNLVSDKLGAAAHLDSHLVNAWGLSAGPSTPFWVSDNGTGESTLYTGGGNAVPLVVSIPAPGGGASTPTGNVYNGSNDFKLDASHPALFIFATEDGTISGWSPATGLTHAIVKVDNSGSAVYKGIAPGASITGNHLYATNFRAGTVDVFDRKFDQVTLAGDFRDPDLPACGVSQPACFAPFNIANLNGRLYVSYALQAADKTSDVAGAGNGFIDVFDMQGHFLHRLVSHGNLNSPWGMEVAPAGFGPFGGDLLVGNFGDGRIDAYDRLTGRFDGQLMEDGRPIVIPGLWGLSFGNGGLAGPRGTLFFTAGIDNEQHGLFGSIK